MLKPWRGISEDPENSRQDLFPNRAADETDPPWQQAQPQKEPKVQDGGFGDKARPKRPKSQEQLFLPEARQTGKKQIC